MLASTKLFLKKIKYPKIVIFLCEKILSIIYFMQKHKRKSTIEKLPDLNTSRKIFKNFKQESHYTIKDESKLPDVECDLSIIVPCYNVELYVSHCIESIVRQSFEGKLEVIVVNDGSTDRTTEIIESLQLPKNYIKINQVNAGVAAARNAGIEISRGKYLLFVDGDDVLPLNSVQKLYERAEADHLDMVVGNVNRLENPKKKMFSANNQFGVRSFNQISICISGMPGSLYNRKLWKDTRFPTGYAFKDTCIPYLIASKVKGFAKLDETTYLYRSRIDGSSKDLMNPNVVDTVYIISYLLNSAQNKNIDVKALNEITIYQLSRYTYERLNKVNSIKLMRAAFVISREIYLSYFSINVDFPLTTIEKDVLRAFNTENFDLWRRASQAWMLTNKLQNI